jgi:hypothetical protein
MSTGGKRCQPIVTSALLRSRFCVSTVSIVCTSDHSLSHPNWNGLIAPEALLSCHALLAHPDARNG